jgi:hypothetical protein
MKGKSRKETEKEDAEKMISGTCVVGGKTTQQPNSTSSPLPFGGLVGVVASCNPEMHGKQQEESHERSEDESDSPAALWLPDHDLEKQECNNE